MAHELDDKDYQIIAALEKDARATFKDIGEEVGLSYSACRSRVSLLVEGGYVAGFTIRKGQGLEKFQIHEYVYVKLDSTTDSAMDAIAAYLEETGQVSMIEHIKGAYDLLIRIDFNDTNDNTALNRVVRNGPGVVRTSTITPIKTIKPLRIYYR